MNNKNESSVYSEKPILKKPPLFKVMMIGYLRRYVFYTIIFGGLSEYCLTQFRTYEKERKQKT